MASLPGMVRVMELPVIRDASREEQLAGRVCQQCLRWIRDQRSYVDGVCILGGRSQPPRWSLELQTCDGFEKG